MSDSNPEVNQVEPVAVSVSAEVEVPTTDAAPVKTVAEPAEVATEETPANGAVKSEAEVQDNSPKQDKYQRNGQDRGQRVFRKHESKSKFDPSKLPITDNPSEIRAQVRITVLTHFLINANGLKG